jgi:hypothetical protein
MTHPAGAHAPSRPQLAHQRPHRTILELLQVAVVSKQCVVAYHDAAKLTGRLPGLALIAGVQHGLLQGLHDVQPARTDRYRPIPILLLVRAADQLPALAAADRAAAAARPTKLLLQTPQQWRGSTHVQQLPLVLGGAAATAPPRARGAAGGGAPAEIDQRGAAVRGEHQARRQDGAQHRRNLVRGIGGRSAWTAAPAAPAAAAATTHILVSAASAELVTLSVGDGGGEVAAAVMAMHQCESARTCALASLHHLALGRALGLQHQRGELVHVADAG